MRKWRRGCCKWGAHSFFQTSRMLLRFALGVFVIAAVARAAPTTNKVLILDTTVWGGLSSVEAVAVVNIGLVPEIVSSATMLAMTAADFSQYRGIVFGDAYCGSTYAAAIATALTWGPQVLGHVILVGTDPVLHGRTAFTENVIAFAFSDPSKVALYACLSCAFHGVPTGTPIPMLNAFGSFTARGVDCYNDVHIVATSPVFTGFTDALLSGWGCSVHNGFDSFPSSFVPLAIANGIAGVGSVAFADGSFGVPYILARGVIPVHCGNAFLEIGEECDNGTLNGVPGDLCSSVCRLHWCGDGIVDIGEECDGGGAACSADCIVIASPPIVRCRSVSALANSVCTSAASVDDGSMDADGGEVACTASPPGPYALGATVVTWTCESITTGLSASCEATVTVVDCTAPTLSCPAPAGALECTDGSAVGVFAPPTAMDQCSDVGVIHCTPPLDSSFPLGTTTVTCDVCDSADNCANCTFEVVVQDTLPPVITGSGLRNLCPPNHEWNSVSIDECITSIVDQCHGVLLPAGADVAAFDRVTSDEANRPPPPPPGHRGGGGSRGGPPPPFQPDIQFINPDLVKVRSERDGNGDGRVYNFDVAAIDPSGNRAYITEACAVTVTHDRRSPAVDSGCAYCLHPSGDSCVC